MRASLRATATAALLSAVAASAEPPRDLDELVIHALAKDPEGRALLDDTEAARARAGGALSLPRPSLMAGIESWGAMEDSPDPKMYMVGLVQPFDRRGERRARSERLGLEADRALADRDRLAADLRLRFWQSAARLEAWMAESDLLSERRAAAEALAKIGLVRYGSGIASSGGSTGGAGAMPSSDDETMSAGMPGPAQAPRVASTARAAGPGPGGAMGAMGAMSSPVAGSKAGGVARPASGGAAMDGGAGDMATPEMGGGVTLASLLRLDAAIARLDAERAVLDARRSGEIEVLALFVGQEAASEVARQPESFLGSPRPEIPELRLAALEREIAGADLALAMRSRQPRVMASLAARVEPEGRFDGANVGVEIELPDRASRATIAAGHAALRAAGAREDAVRRGLAVAARTSRAGLEAARARSLSLASVAVPRASAAFEASRALLANGTGRLEDVVTAWDGLLSVERELIAARREVEMLAAERERVEVEP